MAEPDLFFVLGAPKSGTTWLERALNAHPEVVCKGEGKFHFFRDRLAEAGQAYNRFLKQRNTQVFGEAVFPGLDLDEIDAVFAAFVEGRIRKDGPFPGVKRLGAKDPDFGLYMQDFAPLFPRVDWLHIIRDPRDMALSMLRHMQRVHPEVKLPSDDQALRDNAVGWRDYLERVRGEAKARNLSYLEVTYEAMAANPAGELTRAFAFLKVDTAADTVAACVEAASFRRLSQGRDPGQEDRASFFRRGVAGGWKDELTPAQAQAVLQAAGPAAAALGYR